jgi:hypothetical protein
MLIGKLSGNVCNNQITAYMKQGLKTLFFFVLFRFSNFFVSFRFFGSLFFCFVFVLFLKIFRSYRFVSENFSFRFFFSLPFLF